MKIEQILLKSIITLTNYSINEFKNNGYRPNKDIYEKLKVKY